MCPTLFLFDKILGPFYGLYFTIKVDCINFTLADLVDRLILSYFCRFRKPAVSTSISELDYYSEGKISARKTHDVTMDLII